MRWTLPLLLIGACKVEPQWPDLRDQALCRVQVGCFSTWPDEDACLEARIGARDDDACEDFSLVDAGGCIRALNRQAKDCPTEAAWQVPRDCFDVCAPIPVDTGADTDA